MNAELSKTYNPQEVESRWYGWWESQGYFKADNKYVAVVTAEGESLITTPLKELIDRLELHGYVRQKERETWHAQKHRLAATGSATFSMAGSKSKAKESDGRYTQIIQQLRGKPAKQGKRADDR